MPEASPEERLIALRDNCDKKEETIYYRDLSPEELEKKRTDLVDNLIKITGFETEFDKVKKRFKGDVDPLKIENKILQVQIHTRKMEVEGTLFHLANFDEGMMETYDEKGELIKTRRLLPEEKQMKAPFLQAK